MCIVFLLINFSTIMRLVIWAVMPCNSRRCLARLTSRKHTSAPSALATARTVYENTPTSQSSHSESRGIFITLT
ncbi:hypothetical protein V8C42DRAFT_308477 [Trichoderma barbatum]